MIDYAEIGDRVNGLLKSYEGRKGCSTRSRLDAAARSRNMLWRNRYGKRGAHPVLSLQESFIPMDTEGCDSTPVDLPQELRKKPVSWGRSLYEKEHEDGKKEGETSKAARRRNVPEERMEFLRQEETRKRQRWGDPVNCSGFETHCTKKLKKTLLNLTIGEFLEVQELISVEDKCKIAFLDRDFERLMGGEQEKNSLVARWRIGKDIASANDKILSWAWQNDIPWHAPPPDGWIPREDSEFWKEGAPRNAAEEMEKEVAAVEKGKGLEEVPLWKPEDIEVFDDIVKTDYECLCPADAQCDSAIEQMSEYLAQGKKCMGFAGVAEMGRTFEVRDLLERDILEGPPRIRVLGMELKEDLWAGLPTQVLEHLEANFLPLRELALMRLISKREMRRWWGEDLVAYRDWAIEMATRVREEAEAIQIEYKEQEAKEKAEKIKKLEDEDDRREARTELARDYYIENEGRPEVSFKKVAKKFHVYQTELKEAYWSWMEDQYASSEESFYQ